MHKDSIQTELFQKCKNFSFIVEISLDNTWNTIGFLKFKSKEELTQKIGKIKGVVL